MNKQDENNQLSQQQEDRQLSEGNDQNNQRNNSKLQVQEQQRSKGGQIQKSQQEGQFKSFGFQNYKKKNQKNNQGNQQFQENIKYLYQQNYVPLEIQKQQPQQINDDDSSPSVQKIPETFSLGYYENYAKLIKCNDQDNQEGIQRRKFNIIPKPNAIYCFENLDQFDMTYWNSFPKEIRDHELSNQQKNQFFQKDKLIPENLNQLQKYLGNLDSGVFQKQKNVIPHKQKKVFNEENEQIPEWAGTTTSQASLEEFTRTFEFKSIDKPVKPITSKNYEGKFQQNLINVLGKDHSQEANQKLNNTQSKFKNHLIENYSDLDLIFEQKMKAGYIGEEQDQEVINPTEEEIQCIIFFSRQNTKLLESKQQLKAQNLDDNIEIKFPIQVSDLEKMLDNQKLNQEGSQQYQNQDTQKKNNLEMKQQVNENQQKQIGQMRQNLFNMQSLIYTPNQYQQQLSKKVTIPETTGSNLQEVQNFNLNQQKQTQQDLQSSQQKHIYQQLQKRFPLVTEEEINQILDKFIFSDFFQFQKDQTKLEDKPGYFTYFTMAVSTLTPKQKIWFYKDPSNNTQGPFNSIDMDLWHIDNFFPNTLPIAWFQSAQFDTLETFIKNPSELITKAKKNSLNTQYNIQKFLKDPAQLILEMNPKQQQKFLEGIENFQEKKNQFMNYQYIQANQQARQPQLNNFEYNQQFQPYQQYYYQQQYNSNYNQLGIQNPNKQQMEQPYYPYIDNQILLNQQQQMSTNDNKNYQAYLQNNQFQQQNMMDEQNIQQSNQQQYQYYNTLFQKKY